MKIGILRREVRKRYHRLRNWRAVGREMGITAAMAWRIACEPGYEPVDAKIRVKLGLPAMVEVAACEVCGEVHVGPHPKENGRTHRSTPTGRKLMDIPLWELSWMIRHREAMK